MNGEVPPRKGKCSIHNMGRLSSGVPFKPSKVALPKNPYNWSEDPKGQMAYYASSKDLG